MQESFRNHASAASLDSSFRKARFNRRSSQPSVSPQPGMPSKTTFDTLVTQAEPTLAIDAGNTLATARDLGILSGSQTIYESVGSTDPNDYFRFSLNQINGFSLSLTDLTTDADVQLLDSTGSLIASSLTSGTSPEVITRTLAAGTYYIRVYPYSGSTNYTLNLSASLVSQSANYSTQYGYGLVDAAAAVASALRQPLFPAVPNSGGINWGLDQVNAPEVWARGYTGQGITVAVVDSGVDYTHPDLNDNIWINVREIAGNGIDDDGNGYIDDVLGWDFVDNDNTPLDLDGHGTHIAGAIAAENNGIGVTGVAHGARIMPVRVLDADGFGTYPGIAAGIRYAANNGARVINLSLGGGGSSEEVSAAIQYATQLGAVVVISAGNEGANQPTFPANLTNQWGIAVGAVDINNQIARFSNDAGAVVVNYVVAPGVRTYSTTPNNTYQYYSGTSMAAPYVAGTAALILSANPTLTSAQVVSLLTSTANPGGITV
ncbi:S8 family serine peptidase [Leptothermofonsia sp. ETS-13]|uniref:S8 family serine peptidase n=1 Tax=Leptothermofonsia sp. ETS-13 TaxID=3035696 RepID=UPI003BA3DEC0